MLRVPRICEFSNGLFVGNLYREWVSRPEQEKSTEDEEMRYFALWELCQNVLCSHRVLNSKLNVQRTMLVKQASKMKAKSLKFNAAPWFEPQSPKKAQRTIVLSKFKEQSSKFQLLLIKGATWLKNHPAHTPTWLRSHLFYYALAIGKYLLHSRPPPPPLNICVYSNCNFAETGFCESKQITRNSLQGLFRTTHHILNFKVSSTFTFR
jgi:hypothetical protein